MLRSPRATSVACHCGLWMMQIDSWHWSHTCWDHMILIGPQVRKWVKFDIFGLSYKLTSHDLWPSSVTFDLMNMWKFLHFINKPSLVPIGLQLFKWGKYYILSPSNNLTSDDLLLWCMTFAWTYNGSHIVSINQIWFQSDFNFSNEATFTFSAYLTTWPQMTFNLDMWPLISSTNEGSHIVSLVEIHQSMWKVEKTTTTDNRGQSDPCLSC